MHIKQNSTDFNEYINFPFLTKYAAMNCLLRKTI